MLRMMEEKQQDRIDDYVLGRMTDAESASFEEELAADGDLREQCNYTQVVCGSVSDRAGLERLMDFCDEEDEWGSPWRGTGTDGAACEGEGWGTAAFGYADYCQPPAMEPVASSWVGRIRQMIGDGDYAGALSAIDDSCDPGDGPGVSLGIVSFVQPAGHRRRPARRDDAIEWLRVHALVGLGRLAEAKARLASLRAGRGEYARKAATLYRCLFGN